MRSIAQFAPSRIFAGLGFALLIGCSAESHPPLAARTGSERSLALQAPAPVWASLGTLLPEGYASPRVGASVSLDGDTVVVGAPGDGDDATWTDLGAVYVFTRSGADWTLAQKLIPSDGAAGDGFGTAVSLSGDRLLVGAPLHDEGAQDSGSVYEFERTAGVFGGERRFVQAGLAAGRRFGSAVALAGDRAVVGAPLDDKLGIDAGVAYVFSRAGAVFTEVQKLVAPDGGAGDAFGDSVAITSDKVLVGAPQDDSLAENGGAAWVFTQSGSTFGAPQKLLPNNPSADRLFGKFVALSSDSALVGGSSIVPGFAYFFAPSGGAWSQTLTVPGDIHGVAMSSDTALIAIEPWTLATYAKNGGAWVAGPRLPQLLSFWSTSLSVSNGSFVVGLPTRQNPGDKGGGALVYTNTAGTFTKQADLVAGHGAFRDAFGNDVALSGDTAFVAASGGGPWRGPFPPDEYASRGSVFVYRREGSSFVKRQELAPGEPGAVRFGSSLAVSDDTLIVGADGLGVAVAGDGTLYSRPHGFAEVFVRSNDTWVLQQTLIGAGVSSDRFGYRVAISGDTALVTALENLDNPIVYVFVRTGTSWARQAVLRDDVSGNTAFGSCIALDGDTAFVGAYNEDTSVSESSGALHVFVRSGQDWTRKQKLVPQGLGQFDAFGRGIALSGDRALVGNEHLGRNEGALYAYVREGGVWVEKQKLVGQDGELSLGAQVAIVRDTALVRSYQAVRSYRWDGARWTEPQPVMSLREDALGHATTSIALDETATVALVGGPAVARGGELDAVFPFELRDSGGSGGAGGTAGSGGAAGRAGSGGTGGSDGEAGAAGHAGQGGSDSVGGTGGTSPGGAPGAGEGGLGDDGGSAGASGGTSTGSAGGSSSGGSAGNAGAGGTAGGASDHLGEGASESGCSCHVLRSNDPRDGVWFAALFLAVVVVARRTARDRQPSSSTNDFASTKRSRWRFSCST